MMNSTKESSQPFKKLNQKPYNQIRLLRNVYSQSKMQNNVLKLGYKRLSSS